MDLGFLKKSDTIKFWTHIPGIYFEPGFQFTLDDFSFSSISFEEWNDLDGDYPDHVDYNDTKPVFINGQITKPDNNEDVNEIHEELVENLYTALLLSTGLFLPSPQLSCSYFMNEDSSIYYNVGLSGREWILTGAWKSARWKISNENLERLPVIWNLLKSTEKYWNDSGITELINMLKLTSQPEVNNHPNKISYTNKFWILVSSLEKHILPTRDNFPKDKTITKLFGENLASFFYKPSQSVIDMCSSFYRLRSKIIHGEINDQNLSEKQRNLTIQFRAIYCNTLMCLMHMLHYNPDCRGLKIIDLIEYHNVHKT